MTNELKVVTWNVNGLRTYIVDNLASNKFKTKTEITNDSNLYQLIQQVDPNIICFQETRCSLEKMGQFQVPGWSVYSSSSQGEKGRSGDRYSGVSIWVKEDIKPIKVINQLPTLSEPYQTGDLEGRFIALEMENCILINTYVPNAGTNFEYRTTRWDPAMNEYLQQLNKRDIPVIWVGDLNIARTPYDVHFGDPKQDKKGIRIISDYSKKINDLQTNDVNCVLDIRKEMDKKLDELKLQLHQSEIHQGTNDPILAGYSKAERDGFQRFLDSGYIDVWRELHPNIEYTGATWWNLRSPVHRPKNLGWRIDYIIINESFKNKIQECEILSTIGNLSKTNPSVNKYGSDHCPVYAKILL